MMDTATMMTTTTTTTTATKAIHTNYIDKDEEYLYDLKTKVHESLETERTLVNLLMQREFPEQLNFVENTRRLQDNKNKVGDNYPLLDESFYSFVVNNENKINEVISHVHETTKLFDISYFGFETMKNKYLLKTHSGYKESVYHFFCRVALFIWKDTDNYSKFEKLYRSFLQGEVTHATPTLFNAGTRRPQLASCFLMGIEDNIESIFKTIGNTGLISKYSGGVGLHINNIRSKGSYIYGTNGESQGVVPMLRVLNDTSRFIDQGGGKRKGSFAIYLEPWHADVESFIEMKKSTGQFEERARDLFYALWVSDTFMKRVNKNLDWYLFNPHTCPRLNDVYGDDFEKLYNEYVKEKKYTKQMKARDLWTMIMRSQIETGSPFILFKDQINRCSNQKNLGIIKSSNLCTEIMQYSNSKEYAVCNLASIALNKFLCDNPKRNQLSNVQIITKKDCFFCKLSKFYLNQNDIPFKEIDYKHEDALALKEDCHKTYPQIFNQTDKLIGGFSELWNEYLIPLVDFEKLGDTVEMLCENLNQVIDISFYPLEECRRSNVKHRPMGIGVQGFADLLQILLKPYDDDYSRELNKQIFECIYYHALKKSVSISKATGKTYESFSGSPLSEGNFHFELYSDHSEFKYNLKYDWESLRKDLLQYGCMNSLFIALMPTASTAQILGNTESFEPLTSNVYMRRTLSGEFIIVNRHLQKIMEGINHWTQTFKDKLTFTQGSLVPFKELPASFRKVFSTVWEIPNKSMIEMASDRQRFIDQSQSMNLYLNEPSIDRLNKCLLYGWKRGLKTGSYYVRSQALRGQNFYVSRDKEEQLQEECTNCSA